MKKYRSLMMVTFYISSVLALSCVFAVAGEPQSLWLWRDVLGVLK